MRFENPDQVVDDFRAMTYTSYDEAAGRGERLHRGAAARRALQATPVPLMVIFGDEDQIFDAELSIEGYQDVPGVQTELIQDAGHAPQVEKPEEVAELIEASRSAGARAGAESAAEGRVKPRLTHEDAKPGSDPANEKKPKQ